MSVDHLTPIQKTLFFPLIARGREFKQDDKLLNDEFAHDILNQLPANFLSQVKTDMLTNAIAIGRACLIDKLVSNILRECGGEMMVVSVGCGLCTRYLRMENYKKWIDIDLEEVVELRKKVFEKYQRSNHVDLAGSVMDEKVYETLRDIRKESGNLPILFIAEGLFMYFSYEDLRRMFKWIENYLPGSNIVFEMVSFTSYLANSKSVSSLSQFKSYMSNGRDDLYQINSNFELVSEEFSLEYVRNKSNFLTRRFPLLFPYELPILSSALLACDRIIHCRPSKQPVQREGFLPRYSKRVVHPLFETSTFIVILFVFGKIAWIYLFLIILEYVRGGIFSRRTFK